jgi:hypothetical protein
MLNAHGFTQECSHELVGTGLVTVTAERMPRRGVTLPRLHITEAGRRALK